MVTAWRWLLAAAVVPLVLAGCTSSAGPPRAGWQLEIDTSEPVGTAGFATARKAGDRVTVGPRSVVVLLDPREAPRPVREK